MSFQPFPASAWRRRLPPAVRSALETALDAAESIGAGNSLEKMLAHQLAASHRSAMKLVAEMNRQADYLANVRGSEQDRANVQVTRLAGATARIMTTFQQGLMTLQRMRTGGQQVVTVQHVEARDGGQAVVAGNFAGPVSQVQEAEYRSWPVS